MDDDRGVCCGKVRMTQESTTMATTIPVYVTLPVGCDAMQMRHDIASATSSKPLWSTSGSYSLCGGDGSSFKERTSYFHCMGDDAAKSFREIVTTQFPTATVVIGEALREFRHNRTYRLHTYERDTGPGHRDYVYVQGATRRSPPAFCLAGDKATQEPIKCKAVTASAPGLVGEAAVMPDGALIFAAHEVTADTATAK